MLDTCSREVKEETRRKQSGEMGWGGDNVLGWVRGGSTWREAEGKRRMGERGGGVEGRKRSLPVLADEKIVLKELDLLAVDCARRKKEVRRCVGERREGRQMDGR